MCLCYVIGSQMNGGEGSTLNHLPLFIFCKSVYIHLKLSKEMYLECIASQMKAGNAKNLALFLKDKIFYIVSISNPN